MINPTICENGTAFHFTVMLIFARADVIVGSYAVVYPATLGMVTEKPSA
ncbi:MAG: hypothetical protein WDM88_07650 [Galbitalea sp.]